MAWLMHGMAVVPTHMLYGQMTVAAEGRTTARHRMHFRSAVGLGGQAIQVPEASYHTLELLGLCWDSSDTEHWREQNKPCQLALILTGCYSLKCCS